MIAELVLLAATVAGGALVTVRVREGPVASASLRKDAAIVDLSDVIDRAAERMQVWLRELPEWPRRHPTNKSGSVSAHFGPTILSEHDCILHFARFLNEEGLPWHDLHLELSPGQWMFNRAAGVPPPKRIDLAIVGRDRLAGAPLPVPPGHLPLDAVFEFALASNFWLFGVGAPAPTVRKVDKDVAKVAEYLRSGLADRGYVVVVEECDHQFSSTYEVDARTRQGVEVRLLRRWAQDP